MSYHYHSDREKYFELQYHNTRKSILPYIQSVKPLLRELRVLEIGCRDGGVLKPFLESGCHITGLDLDEKSIQDAIRRFRKEIIENKAFFVVKNVNEYIAEHVSRNEAKFDIIILKDVIEHIHERELLFARLKYILKPTGIVFFGLPPWMNPFGGHQQVLSNKFLSKIPYIHILPDFIYFRLVGWLQPSGLAFVKDIKSTKITIEEFEHLVKKYCYTVNSRTLYFIAPMYEHKFGSTARKLNRYLGMIPWFRNFITTTAEYIISSSDKILP